MTALALIATMVALAAPTAHGSFALECKPIRADGMTFGQPRVVLNNPVCRMAARTIQHRHASPEAAQRGLGTLLHEATHVAQIRAGAMYDGRNYEHAAECNSLRALPGVLYHLHYVPSFVRQATALRRDEVQTEAAPYGGTC